MNRIVKSKSQISVIGLGFVGLPMSILLADKLKHYNVIGLEKKNSHGRNLVRKINNKIFPITSADKKLEKKFIKVINKNFFSTLNKETLFKSNVIFTSVNFDGDNLNKNLNEIKKLTKLIFTYSKPRTLIIFESTFIPGTINKIIIPFAKKIVSKRKLNLEDFFVIYSYERIMPGANYYNSICNTDRIYSGINNISKKKFKDFFKKIINKKNKLIELDSIFECETSKILENSYRAINICMIDEWTKFSILNNIDLIKIIDSIKRRKTHKNLMYPGLGMGGYCLTKDPQFINYSKFFTKKKNNFPFIDLTTKTSKIISNTAIYFFKKNIKNKKFKKTIVFGYSYKNDIGDIRNSQSVIFVEKIKKFLNSKIDIYDPYVKNKNILNEKPNLKKYDLIIFCTNHSIYKNINYKNIKKKAVIFDLNNILSSKKIKKLRIRNIVYALGRRND